MICPEHLYEWTVQAQQNSILSLKNETETLNNLRSHRIRQKFVTRPDDVLIRMYHEIVGSIKDKTMPVDLVDLSCTYASFSEMWLDVLVLKDLLS